MELATSASEQNVFLSYVCTINGLNPTKENLNSNSKKNNQHDDSEIDEDDDHIKVERSKALHGLIDANPDKNMEVVASYAKITSNAVGSKTFPTTSSDDSENSEIGDQTFDSTDNPRLIKLTKMKWLTEDREESPDSRSSTVSLSPTSSTSSQYSRESESNLEQRTDIEDKYLSTILRLDKEHNLFGLSNIAIVAPRSSKKTCKKDEKAIFHQTAIVQICCKTRCCRNKSNSDLPEFLKCGGCIRCGVSPNCSGVCVCSASCIGPPTCGHPPNPSCSSCQAPCRPSKCVVDCVNCFGLKVSVRRRPEIPISVCELTPRSSCVLSKPMASRSCHHLPHCLPPSSCFPYLMPCYWPARSAAPCSNPTKCFHNPPCPAPRKPLSKKPVEKCPSKCIMGPNKKCKVMTCPGIEKKKKTPEAPGCYASIYFSEKELLKKAKKKTPKVTCECAVPKCVNCFVSKPEEPSITCLQQIATEDDSKNKSCQSNNHKVITNLGTEHVTKGMQAPSRSHFDDFHLKYVRDIWIIK